MSPPEGGRNIHVTSLRRSSEALAIDQCLGLITPAVLVVRSSQLCPGQRIECLAAIGAAVPRPPMGLTPGTHVVPPTMGTSQTGDTAAHSLRDQNFIRRGIDGLCDRDGGRVRGHANRSKAGAPAVRRCNRIIRLNQRQFPKHLIPLSRVQVLHSGEPLNKPRRVHFTHPSPRSESLIQHNLPLWPIFVWEDSALTPIFTMSDICVPVMR